MTIKPYTPILFHTKEDLQEAVSLEVIERVYTTKYLNGEYTFPTLFWRVSEDIVKHQSCKTGLLLDKNSNYLYRLYHSVDWEQIRTLLALGRSSFIQIKNARKGWKHSKIISLDDLFIDIIDK